MECSGAAVTRYLNILGGNFSLVTFCAATISIAAKKNENTRLYSKTRFINLILVMGTQHQKQYYVAGCAIFNTYNARLMQSRSCINLIGF
jgi:hypothetical protein